MHIAEKRATAAIAFLLQLQLNIAKLDIICSLLAGHYASPSAPLRLGIPGRYINTIIIVIIIIVVVVIISSSISSIYHVYITYCAVNNIILV